MPKSDNSEGQNEVDEARRRRRRRVLVLALAVAYGLQLVYVTVAEEPFPAIMMPRFSFAGPSGDATVEMPVPEITLVYRDETTRVLE